MSTETMIKDTGRLLDVWVAGWAGCRGYKLEKEGRFHAAPRENLDGEFEYFAHDPSDEEFAALAALTLENDKRLLSVLTKDPQRYLALAAAKGLNVSSTSETMMIVDMATQDTEDPWLPDDDLELATSVKDGVHYVVVHAGEKVAASGRVNVVNHTAVFDAIVTDPEFQRRGLGSFIMKSLAAQAFEHDVENGLLLASSDGQKLYAHLGWQQVCNVMVFSGTTEPVQNLSLV
ncbi:GNAT family N-acetyltransferase [Pseudarthrobacter sp. J1763]|uniref:GNAT family N-acetyltransferase n=1 Tax=Pseudarthrobacter sp. J1763 TaxID=3420445 RepID=UPI003D273543